VVVFVHTNTTSELQNLAQNLPLLNNPMGSSNAMPTSASDLRQTSSREKRKRKNSCLDSPTAAYPGDDGGWSCDFKACKIFFRCTLHANPNIKMELAQMGLEKMGARAGTLRKKCFQLTILLVSFLRIVRFAQMIVCGGVCF